MDANKILDTLAARFANKNAQMEKEIALLVVKNESLKAENEELKKRLNGNADDKVKKLETKNAK